MLTRLQSKNLGAEEKVAEEQAVSLEAIAKALEVVHLNGFGFQCDGVQPVGSLVVAFLSRDHLDSGKSGDFSECKETKVWRTALKLDERFKLDNWLGRAFIQVHYTLFDRIPEIVQYGLDHGFRLNLRTGIGGSYRAGETFVYQDTEARFTEYFNKLVDKEKLWSSRDSSGPKPKNMITYVLESYYTNQFWKMLLPWNWNTPTGQAFCAMLRTECPHLIEADEAKYNYYQWPKTAKALEQAKVYDYSAWWRAPSVYQPK